MTTQTLLRRASVALAAFTLACGDSTAPDLSQAEVGDMLDAMSAVSFYGDVPGMSLGAGGMGGSSLKMANATVNVSQTVDCPNGGSANVVGTATDNESNGTVTLTAQVTQSFTGCAATSEHGRVWTFNGAPNIVTNINASSNESTGAFSLTVTQVGGIRFTSNLGEGTCQINLTVTMSGDADSFQGSISGSACGRNISQSMSVTQ